MVHGMVFTCAQAFCFMGWYDELRKWGAFVRPRSSERRGKEVEGLKVLSSSDVMMFSRVVPCPGFLIKSYLVCLFYCLNFAWVGFLHIA